MPSSGSPWKKSRPGNAPTIATISVTNAAAAAYFPSTMSQIVSGLVMSSSCVPLVFSETKSPMVMPGITKSSTTAIESKK